jgi:hypothetical protein
MVWWADAVAVCVEANTLRATNFDAVLFEHVPNGTTPIFAPCISYGAPSWGRKSNFCGPSQEVRWSLRKLLFRQEGP